MCGLKEATKLMTKMSCVIVAPDIQRSRGPGNLFVFIVVYDVSQQFLFLMPICVQVLFTGKTIIFLKISHKPVQYSITFYRSPR